MKGERVGGMEGGVGGVEGGKGRSEERDGWVGR